MDAANAEPSVSAVVPLEGRGPLVYEVLHGRPLYVTAGRHVLDVAPDAVVLVSAGQRARVVEDLAAAGLRAPVLDAEQWWASLAAGAARALLVHDPLCPLAPPDLMARVCGQDAGTSVAAVRPVTDTVKVAEAGRITGTIDRQTLAAVASPLLVAAPVLARALAAGDRPPLDDVARLVSWMRAGTGRAADRSRDRPSRRRRGRGAPARGRRRAREAVAPGTPCRRRQRRTRLHHSRTSLTG